MNSEHTFNTLSNILIQVQQTVADARERINEGNYRAPDLLFRHAQDLLETAREVARNSQQEREG